MTTHYYPTPALPLPYTLPYPTPALAPPAPTFLPVMVTPREGSRHCSPSPVGPPVKPRGPFLTFICQIPIDMSTGHLPMGLLRRYFPGAAGHWHYAIGVEHLCSCFSYHPVESKLNQNIQIKFWLSPYFLRFALKMAKLTLQKLVMINNQKTSTANFVQEGRDFAFLHVFLLLVILFDFSIANTVRKYKKK